MTTGGLTLSDGDRELIEAQVFDSKLSPRFDAVKSCLIWDDELPRDITPDGYKFLCDLWVARAHLHHGHKLDEKLFNVSYYVGVWDWARSRNLQWPGFLRTALSDADKAVYLECLNVENPFD